MLRIYKFFEVMSFASTEAVVLAESLKEAKKLCPSEINTDNLVVVSDESEIGDNDNYVIELPLEKGVVAINYSSYF